MRWEQYTSTLQFDLTSHCNARCGACIRNVYGNDKKPELQLIHFSKDIWERIASKDTRGWWINEIQLNGNWGDPMMHPDIIEMIDVWSSYHTESEFYVHTNGSMRTADFWKDLANTFKYCLNHLMIFSIDGLEDTHSIYRRKTDFEKIKENIETFTNAGGKAKIIMTLFDHNKHQVTQVEQLAEKLGCAWFELRHSHGDNLLIKDKTDYIINADYSIDPYIKNFNWERKYNHKIRDTDLLWDINEKIEKLETKCPWYNMRRVQIDPWGNVWPCCHTSLSVDLNNPITDRNLNKNNLSVILDNNYFTKLLPESLKNKPWEVCKRICGV